MFYEEKITSFASLRRRLRVLDQDAGARLMAGSGKRKFMMFVTRFGSKYTVMTYTLRSDGTPGRRLRILEFDSLEGLEEALRKLAPNRLRAWIY